jgi:sec-independent protein translocase protein TatC
MKFKFRGRSPAEMPFLDHLEELRWRILWSLLALLVCSIIGFVVVTEFDVIGILKRPLDPYLPSGKLIYLSVTDPFFITIRLAIAFGVVVASPIIFYQIWAFLSPALLPREKRAIVPSLYLGLILFAAGVALAYFLALPITIKFMQGFQVESLEANITAGFYFGFVTRMLLAFGVIFELPVIVLILSALGLITSKFLKSKRRYAVAVMAVTAAVITPGDAITLTIFMMGPLLILYEMSIGLARLVERGRERQAQADALPEAT